MYFPEGPARETVKVTVADMSFGIRHRARLPEADPAAPEVQYSHPYVTLYGGDLWRYQIKS